MLYREALLSLISPSQPRGPGSACSELFQCAIHRLLSLTQDRIGTSPLPQAATLCIQIPKHTPQSLRIALSFFSHPCWCAIEQKMICVLSGYCLLISDTFGVQIAIILAQDKAFDINCVSLTMSSCLGFIALMCSMLRLTNFALSADPE